MQIEQEFAMSARCRLVTNRRSRPFGASFALRVRSFSATMTGGNVGQMLSSAGDRETFFVEKALDFENGFDVVAAVEAMAAGAFYGLQRREFGLPVTQDEGFRRRQAAHFADAEKALLRNFRRGMCSGGHMFSVSYYSGLRVRRWKLEKLLFAPVLIAIATVFFVLSLATRSLAFSPFAVFAARRNVGARGAFFKALIET